MSDRVAALRREPDVAVFVEHQGVRIAHHPIGNRILLDAAVFRIEPSDVSREIAREPHESRLVHDQIVRTAAGRQIVALELARRRHEVGEVVARLAAEPDAVGGRIEKRVARARVRPWYGPFFDDRRLIKGGRGGWGGNGGKDEKECFHGYSPVSILRCNAVNRLRTEPSNMRSPTRTTTPPRILGSDRK